MTALHVYATPITRPAVHHSPGRHSTGSTADTEPPTCVHCLGRARGNLTAILDAYALLPDEVTDQGGVSFQPIPRGSGETAILGGGGFRSRGGRWRTACRPPRRARATAPEWRDPLHPLQARRAERP